MVLAMGTMRLSTSASVDEATAQAVIEAGLDAGIRLLDTADAYAPDEHQLGHNERLIAQVLRRWSGPPVRVVTKGGLTRPGGRWVPDGRARHLRAACEASRRALDVPELDLYLLHTVDPKTPLATSARALARLQREGAARAVGLCNVTVEQIEAASAHMQVAAVQVGFSPWDPTAVRAGVVQYCLARGIEVLLHSPLGGPRRQGRAAKNAVVVELARAHDARPQDIVLAWLRSLGPLIPLPGPTRASTAKSCGEAITLKPAEVEVLDREFPIADQLRRSPQERRPPAAASGDVVMVLGRQGSGKTSYARQLVQSGYTRLNRDDEGGSLAKLHRRLDQVLGSGIRKVVLDNTYPSRAIRNEVVELAWRHGVPARAVWMTASVEDARIGVVQRMLRNHGRLLGPDELKTVGKSDPSVLPPSGHARYARAFETPRTDEGIEVEQVPFVHPRGSSSPWVLLDLGALPEDDAERERVGYELRGLDGPIVGFHWRPSGAQLREADARWVEKFGLDPAIEVCPHPAGPVTCWCRPPQPGLLLAAAHRHQRSLAAATLVGRAGFASRFAEAARVGRFREL